MASRTAALVRLLGGRAAAAWEWRSLVEVARAIMPVLGTSELALPDDLFVAPVGAITIAAPEGVAVVVPDDDLCAAVGPAGSLRHAAAAALLAHELAHVAVLRRLPGLTELSPEARRDMEAVALMAQCRVLAHLLDAGTWQDHLAAAIAAAAAWEDPLLSAYEAAGELLLGEWESLSYPELVSLVAERLGAAG